MKALTNTACVMAALVVLMPILGIGLLAAASDNWFCGMLCGMSVPEALRWLKNQKNTNHD